MRLASFAESVTAIELSEIATKQATVAATNLAIDNVSFVAGDIREFDKFTQNQKFDIILAMGVLHHLSYNAISKVLALAQNALRSTGRFISTDPNRYRAVGIFKVFVPGLVQKYHSPDERELAPGKLRRLLRHNGFGDVTIHYISYFLYPLAWVFPDLPQNVMQIIYPLDHIFRKLPVIKLFSASFACIAKKNEDEIINCYVGA